MGEEDYSSGEEWNIYNTKPLIDIETCVTIAKVGAFSSNPYVKGVSYAVIAMDQIVKVADFILNKSQPIVQEYINSCIEEGGINTGKLVDSIYENGVPLLKQMALQKSMELVLNESTVLAIKKNLEKGVPAVLNKCGLGKVVEKVGNMTEFFKHTKFGKQLKKVSDRTNKLSKTKEKVYRVTEKNGTILDKGDQFYIDRAHTGYTHLEVFDNRGNVKCVMDMKGKIDIKKTEEAIKQGRTL